MIVRAQDGGDTLARRCGDQGFDMRGAVRPRIDHRHLPSPDYVGLRAGIGEGRRVRSEHASHERVERDRSAGWSIEHDRPWQPAATACKPLLCRVTPSLQQGETKGVVLHPIASLRRSPQ
jgi:hypothetical protein